MFQEYYQKGIVVIPLKEKGIPAIQWSQFFLDANYLPSEEEVKSWKQKNIALLCGERSKIVAIDIDIDAPEKISLLTRIIGKTPCSKKGSKGITLFYKYNGEHSKPLKDKDGNLVVEILSDKRLTTIPPSKHRSKDLHYTWEGVPLLEAELPVLVPHYLEAIRKVFAIPEEVEQVRQSYSYKETPELEKAQELLDYCNPDCDRIEWINIGSALRSCYGDGAFYMFDDWSAKSKKYNKKEIRNVWRSFQDGYSFGVIYNIAKKFGYQPEFKESVVIDLSKWEQKKLQRLAEENKEKQIAQNDLVETAPPLIRDLTKWIYENARYSQPMLSLGAVIATIGFIMGRKYTLETTRPNLYVASLAGSQEGKEDVITAVRVMLECAGMNKKMERTWSAGSAIESALEANEHEVMYCSDELSIILKSLVGKFQNINQSEAYSSLLQLSSTNYYKGKSYTNRKERPTLESYYPNVVIYGSAQPETFFDAMGNEQAVSGFLNRLLIFQAPFERPLSNKNRDFSQVGKVPEHLAKQLKSVVDNYDSFVSSHRLTRDNLSRHILKPVMFNQDALEVKNQMQDEIDIKFNQFKKDGSKMHLIIGRAIELIDKVALIASCGFQSVSLENWLWAKKVVENSLGIMCQASAELISNNDWERDLTKISMFIRQNQVVSKTELTNRFRQHNSLDLEKFILKLQDMDEVILGADKTGMRKKAVYISNKNKPENFQDYI